jgi:hypothetical protein
MMRAFGSIAPKIALGVALRPRLGESVHGQHLRERDQVLGLHGHAGPRRGAGVQWMRGAVRADAEGAVSLPAPVPRPGGGAPGDRAFIAQYNAEWIVERLGYRTPAQARRDALQEAA